MSTVMVSAEATLLARRVDAVRAEASAVIIAFGEIVRGWGSSW